MSQPHLSGSWAALGGAGGGSLAQRHSGGSSGAVGALEATLLHSGCPGSRFARVGGGASGRKALANLGCHLAIHTVRDAAPVTAA